MESLQFAVFLIGGGGLLSAVTTWISLSKFLKEQRNDIERRANAEGVREQVIANMKKDIDYAHEEIRLIKDQSVKTNTAITELVSDVKHAVSVIKDIKNYIENKRTGCV